MREPAHGGGPRHQLGGHPAPRATHPSWRVAQRQRHACEVKMAPEAWLAAVVHLAHTAEAATTARDARCRLDVADQARLGELHRLDDSELDSEHGVEQGCSAHGRRGSEGWFGNPRGTPSAVRVPQPFLLAHLVPTDPRRIPPPCDEITPARLPPNLSESHFFSRKTGAAKGPVHARCGNRTAISSDPHAAKLFDGAVRLLGNELHELAQIGVGNAWREATPRRFRLWISKLPCSA